MDGHGAFARAWRAKNLITLNSIPLLITPSIIHYFCACEGGLYKHIQLNTGFDEGIIQMIGNFRENNMCLCLIIAIYYYNYYY